MIVYQTKYWFLMWISPLKVCSCGENSFLVGVRGQVRPFGGALSRDARAKDGSYVNKDTCIITTQYVNNYYVCFIIIL